MDIETMTAEPSPTTESKSPAKPPPLPSQRGAERRVRERKRLEAEIGFYSDSNFFTGFTEDLSEGGVFVATYDLQPIGTEIDVEFTLPGGQEVKVRGQVRWLRDPMEETPGLFPGMGVQFQTVAPEALAAIQEFIGNRAPLFYDGDE